MILKEQNTIHKIKSLYINADGLSKKAIVRELNISRTTVSKDLSMDEKEILNTPSVTGRHKQLDDYREYVYYINLGLTNNHQKICERL